MKNIISEIKNNVLYIAINRPAKLNALNIETLQELDLAIENAIDSELVKAIIITGVGEKAFVAGADISEIADVNEINARKFSERGQEIFDRIELCPKPVIAAVNGFALGGGFELALACHIRIVSENAKFGLPEVTLGIIPAYGGTQRLSHLIGKGRAFEMMMTGDMIDAQEAYRLGIANKVVALEELYKSSEDMLSKITSRSPFAIAQLVECVVAAFDEEENGFQVESNAFSICCKSEDFKEGTQAFLEKRKPNFTGK
ncbi:MAG: enoyl-CoA hydratase [Cytophagales bacterium]|nr:MAG: enoyl-CoA hydratase [Cytophagales bacterium]